MRPFVIAAIGVLAVAGCTSERTLPRGALVARANAQPPYAPPAYAPQPWPSPYAYPQTPPPSWIYQQQYPSWQAPTATEPPPTARGMAAIAFASAQIGHPYCWGGLGPRCFDCSGLVDRAWSHAGIHLPRTSEDIAHTLPEVPLEEIRAGDILWWPGHVGLYTGNGWMIDALDSRHGVVRRPASDPYRAYRPNET